MHFKQKLQTCTIQIELIKVGFVGKKVKQFKIFQFSPSARGPQKFPMYNFFNFLKNKRQNWPSGTWQIWKGTNSGSLVNIALTMRQQQTDSW